jgi:phosphate butyryltransferase
MILRNFDELVGVAKTRGSRRVAVARAEDDTVVEGLEIAAEEELIEPILFGDQKQINAVLKNLGIKKNWQIVHTTGGDEDCAKAAVSAVRQGDAELLMKGQMHTSVLFRAVLDRKEGLPREGILSHMVVIETAHYHKLFAFTDGGLNVNPSLEQKVAITRNAIAAFHALGYRRPKVGLLSYIEKVKEGDPETNEWAKIAAMGGRGELGEADIEGPLALDLCLSDKATIIKGYRGNVGGDVDIIIAPNITAGNSSAKALLLTGGTAGGVVLGSSVPIIALSRGDPPRTRLCSLALASALFS